MSALNQKFKQLPTSYIDNRGMVIYDAVVLFLKVSCTLKVMCFENRYSLYYKNNSCNYLFSIFTKERDE
jgi:hypothetical protein